jgi:hypothetical protein
MVAPQRIAAFLSERLLDDLPSNDDSRPSLSAARFCRVRINVGSLFATGVPPRGRRCQPPTGSRRSATMYPQPFFQLV